MSRGWRVGIPLLLAGTVAIAPVPAGLTQSAWHYAALTIGPIARRWSPSPFRGRRSVSVAVTLACLLLLLVEPTSVDSLRWALSGFADSTVWRSRR